MGQTHVTRTLQNAIKLDRVHHAFLFTGSRGVGKTTAARILAKALNCEQGPTPEPCNECHSCKEITAGIASDVQEIDAASHTGVDDIRELRGKLRYLPSSGRRRIYIIDEIHMLSTSAFNALLKTLEEPPPHVVFIFATTDPQKLPDTILSRCQRFDFKRIPIKLLAEKLSEIAGNEGIEITESALLTICREAEGSMRDAESLLDQVLSATADRIDEQVVAEVLGLFDRSLLFDCVDGVLTGDADRSIQVVHKVHTFGFDIRPFARDLLEMIRHLNVIEVAANPERLMDVSSEEFSRLSRMAERCSPEVLSRQFDLLLKGYDEVSRSPSPRLALEMTLLRMARARPAQPLDALLSRLKDLERAVRRAGVVTVPQRPRSVPGTPERIPPAATTVGIDEPASREAVPAHRPVETVVPASHDDAVGPHGEQVARAASEEAAVSPTQPPSGRFRGSRSEDATQAPERGEAGASSGPRTRGEGSGHDRRDDSSRSRQDRTDAPSESTGPADLREVPVAPSAVSSEGEGGGAAGGEKSWYGFLDYWAGLTDPPVRTIYLRGACVISEEPARVVLGVRERFALPKVRRELKLREVQDLLRRYYGCDVTVTCRLLEEGDAAGASYQEREDERANARKERLLAGLLEDASVQAAMKIFGIDPKAMDVKIGLP